MSDDGFPAIDLTSAPPIEPLVPPEVDLRGLLYMPLYGDLLIKSRGWILASGDGAKAMIQLWCHAFTHEVPAASLPNDDRLLASYAGYGAGPDGRKAWSRVKGEALWKWQLATDGRLYHPILAGIALRSWSGRTAASALPKSSDASRQARHRAKVAGRRRELATLGIAAPKGATLAELDEMMRDALGDVSPAVTGDGDGNAHGDAVVTVDDAPVTRDGDVTRNALTVTRNASAVTTIVTRNAPVTPQGKETVEGQGTGVTTENNPAAQLITGQRESDGLRCAQDELVYEVARAAVRAAGLDEGHVETEFDVVQGWLRHGVGKTAILQVVQAKVIQARKAGKRIGSLAYFTAPLRDSVAGPAQHDIKPTVTVDPAQRAEYWRRRLRDCISADGWDVNRWRRDIDGPAPPMLGHRVPAEILAEADFRPHFPSLFPASTAAA
ncbi:MAG: hypothetical protein J0H82_06185 [Alphaproteobacteria bacterium]|jgi:hypothetical protein|nr:hypothetical protein [Alphaproteobacteria bacterium]